MIIVIIIEKANRIYFFGVGVLFAGAFFPNRASLKHTVSGHMQNIIPIVKYNPDTKPLPPPSKARRAAPRYKFQKIKQKKKGEDHLPSNSSPRLRRSLLILLALRLLDTTLLHRSLGSRVDSHNLQRQR